MMFYNLNSVKLLFQNNSFSISISNLLGFHVFLYIIAKNIVHMTIIYINRLTNDKCIGIRNK